MNRKLLMSLGIIVFVAAVAIGATGAFFSDSETSTGNVLAAGAIDLGIDNHSYYNGQLNASTTWRIDYDIDTTEYPGDNPATLDVVEDGYSLPVGRQYFNFNDLKPGDWGEDTISIHVKDNDSWICADVTLTSDNDNTLTEPEGDDGDTTGGVGEGELADAVNFYWWADDGDNVFETCIEGSTSTGCVSETLLPAGPLGVLAVGQTATVPLADSQTNIWANASGTPLEGDSVRYIAKAWCFGDSLMAPYPQDGGNQQSGPDDRPVICDGSGENNVTQTDSLTADITFRAVQSRHNSDFLCVPPVEQATTTSLTVIKIVTNDDGGNNVIADFALNINGTSTASGAVNVLPPGAYDVSETGVAGYEATFSGDCDADGDVTLALGEQKVCTITNNDIAPNITLTKVVVGGQNDPGDFTMRIDGTPVPSGSSLLVTANAPHAITEDFTADYSGSISGDPACPLVLGGTATLDEGAAISCTITNTLIVVAE